MVYNPEIHNRKSLRLNGYDYTKIGLYFITICIKNKECLFGKIDNNKMILNQIGTIANDYWIDIPKHYPQVVLHEHILMPNHMHGIIEITSPVGSSHGTTLQQQHGTTLQQSIHIRQFSKPIPGSISTIINQYKSSVKRWCNKNGLIHFQWQSRFYDHIIRNLDAYENITNYIISNPIKWPEDKNYQS